MKKITYLIILFSSLFCFAEDFILIDHQKKVKDFIIPFISNPEVKIDGILNEKIWEKALFIDEFYLLNKKTKPEKNTNVYIFYSEDAIYFAFKCEEEKTDLLISSFKKDGSPIWSEDCIEIFIDNSHTHKKYFQFLVNFASIKTGFYWLTPKGFSIDLSKGWFAKAKKFDKYWIVECKIPFNLLGIDKRYIKGNCWGINFTRESYVGNPELISHVPLETTFHQPDKFNHFYFSFKPEFDIEYLKINRENGEIEIRLTPESELSDLFLCYSFDNEKKINREKIIEPENKILLTKKDFDCIKIWLERMDKRFFYRELENKNFVEVKMPAKVKKDEFNFEVWVSPILKEQKDIKIFWYIEKIVEGHLLLRKEGEEKLKCGKNYFTISVKDFPEGKYNFVVSAFAANRTLFSSGYNVFIER